MSHPLRASDAGQRARLTQTLGRLEIDHAARHLLLSTDKAEHANVVFVILGRALALAARFVSGCRALSSLMHLKEDPSPLDSKECLRAFSDPSAGEAYIQSLIDMERGK